jgi:hypothetical protein
MSHVANVEVEIQDIGSLKSACTKLGLTFKEGQQTHRWYGKFMNDWDTDDSAVANGYDPKTFGTCEHAIEVPGSDYDIGVVKNPKGSGYRLIYDTWGHQGDAIANKLGGMKLTKLKTEYGASRATKYLQRSGYRVVRRVLANGQVKISGVK